MSNGRNLTIGEARANIKAFENHEKKLGASISNLAVGQKIDLDVLQRFMDAIKNHPQSKDIDAIRIYLARSVRHGQKDEHYDVVLVPVLNTDEDLQKVYAKSENKQADYTIIGEALPCPNVCPNKGFHCN